MQHVYIDFWIDCLNTIAHDFSVRLSALSVTTEKLNFCGYAVMLQRVPASLPQTFLARSVALTWTDLEILLDKSQRFEVSKCSIFQARKPKR